MKSRNALMSEYMFLSAPIPRLCRIMVALGPGLVLQLPQLLLLLSPFPFAVSSQPLRHVVSPCENTETGTHLNTPSEGWYLWLGLFIPVTPFMWFVLSHTREVLWGWGPVASPGNDTATASLGLSCGLNIDLCDMKHLFTLESCIKALSKKLIQLFRLLCQLFGDLRQIILIFGDKFKA